MLRLFRCLFRLVVCAACCIVLCLLDVVCLPFLWLGLYFVLVVVVVVFSFVSYVILVVIYILVCWFVLALF